MRDEPRFRHRRRRPSLPCPRCHHASESGERCDARAGEPNVEAPAVASPAAPAPTASTEAVDRGFLYGRVTTDDGGAYVGRLRFGRDEEAFWGDYFNGF